MLAIHPGGQVAFDPLNLSYKICVQCFNLGLNVGDLILNDPLDCEACINQIGTETNDRQNNRHHCTQTVIPPRRTLALVSLDQCVQFLSVNSDGFSGHALLPFFVRNCGFTKESPPVIGGLRREILAVHRFTL